MTKPRQDLAALRVVTGDDVVDQTLASLQAKGSDAAIRAGIRACFQPIVKALRMAVNRSPASPRLRAAARATIGARFGKARGGAAKGQYQAKVGFGVGKQIGAAKQKSRLAAAKKKRAAKYKASTHGTGVGISKTNIHWPILGTDERFHGGKNTGTVFRHLMARKGMGASTQGKKSVGKMPADLKGLMQQALVSAQSECFAEARRKVVQILKSYMKG